MRKQDYIWIIIASLVTLSACSKRVQPNSTAGVYEQEIEKFRTNRVKELTTPYGWTSVVGLFELKEGENLFGSGDHNAMVFPKTAPEVMGVFVMNDKKVAMAPADGVNIMIDGKAAEAQKLNNDYDQGGPTICNWGSLQWFVASRKERTFIRLRDTLSPYRSALKKIDAYPTTKEYIINAKFIPAGKDDKLVYNTAIGVEYENPVMGYAEFDWKGTKQRLTLLDGGKDLYSIVFADETTGIETYGGGRFLYPKKEIKNGMITLDFNKAINPPCVFTPYATCPLPAKENHLKMKVEAGEKMVYIY